MDNDAPALQIHVLGGLRVERNGQTLTLPASKNTRALLGYLIVTGRPHRRERLCDLLWDGPDDPRAELRWSVSKLRPVVNSGAATRLVADREQIGFVPLGATVDLDTMGGVSGSADRLGATPVSHLKAAARLFYGELLDGLDLPLCYRYQEWCLAERERVSRQYRALLAALVERLSDQPDDALEYARALAAADPLAEAGHVAVVRLLGRLGRKREAIGHYDRARRLLEAELDVSASDELTGAFLELSATTAHGRAESLTPREASTRTRTRTGPTPHAIFVGRSQERGVFDRIGASARADHSADVVFITGEPGIGKSHLLDYLAERVTVHGGTVLSGRAYEAEAARPYGIWIDLARTVVASPGVVPPTDLGFLLPELGARSSAAADRTRLFDAVVELLRQTAGGALLLLILDDLHWLDESSCALMHYLARQLKHRGFVLACAARTGEIDDNAAAIAVLRSLRREGRLREIALSPLSPAETSALAKSVAPSVDSEWICQASRGNPLFTVELARAHQHGEDDVSRTIAHLVRQQVDRLSECAQTLLLWASALDRGFRFEDLVDIVPIEATQVLAGLDELERFRLIDPSRPDAYAFRHDLIRETVYQSASQPRRALVHRQIGRALIVAADANPALAIGAAHHAALGGDHEVAVRACVLAGQHAIKLFAVAEARGFAERGLQHLDQLPRGATTVECRMALLEIHVQATMGIGMRARPLLAKDVIEAVAAAEAFGLQDTAATGHYLLSVLYQEAGDQPHAEQSTLRAAQAGRTTSHPTQAHQFANTARCLLELETQVSRARGLLTAAEAVAIAGNLELCEIYWAKGLLRRWDGDLVGAAQVLERALSLARRLEDRRREHKCLTWLAIVAFEQGQAAAVATYCDELMAVARRMGNAATPFVATLRALVNLPAKEVSSGELRSALDHLRAVDDKSYLAYSLNEAARLAWQVGDTAVAAEHAREALAASTIMRRQNEVAIARSLLTHLGDDMSAREAASLFEKTAELDKLSARARLALLAAVSIPGTISTLASRPSDQASSHNRVKKEVRRATGDR